jgi:Polysaccharide lyase family 4, domain II/Polysaccharide lyase family 4, domain III
MRLRGCIYTLLALVCSFGPSRPAQAQLSIDTSNPLDWKISNGSLTLDWDSQTGNVFGVFLAGHPDNLVDTTHTGAHGQPSGLYMDNDGTNLGSGTVTAGFHRATAYLDWWVTTASSATNAFTLTRHFLLQPNQPTLHVYVVADHSATDIAGNLGQVQYVFRLSQTLFNQTYSDNSGLHNQGPTTIPLPSPTVLNNTDPGRQVSNAVLDLHGLPLPAGFSRQFYTKYDYSSYEYQHLGHGVFGSTYGAWTVIPRAETLTGGPSKQNLIFTDNILMMECLSGHLIGSAATYAPPQGVATRRLFGPYAFHFNVFDAALPTPDDLYDDAVGIIPSALALYNIEGELHANGYVVATDRGTVQTAIAGGGPTPANAAWAVLADNATNFQASAAGYQYWQNLNADGTATIAGVAPGSYRLSAYVLGQWGELRVDNVNVPAGGELDLTALQFTPENFASTAPVWTIGTPDRSASEFRHGNLNGIELRNFWGSYNYWQDYAATQGAQIYYATAVGSQPATNDVTAINYVLWGQFDPGLFGGVFNASDDTTDGYTFAIPGYVAGLPGAAGSNGVSTKVPPMTVHFITTSAQAAGARFAVLSVGLAAAEGSLTVSLNGHPLSWHAIKTSDAMVRSGLAGYFQWIAYQWDLSNLNPAGFENTLTFTTSGSQGDMFDALRFELTATSADPAVTGWHDYEYLYNGTYVPANDKVPNN